MKSDNDLISASLMPVCLFFHGQKPGCKGFIPRSGMIKRIAAKRRYHIPLNPLNPFAFGNTIPPAEKQRLHGAAF
jgi:hypothetical protein